MIIDHDKENHNLFIRWGENYAISEDYGDYILDYDENKNIIGIELLNFEGE
jgi:uncharacterized protein YuzE